MRREEAKHVGREEMKFGNPSQSQSQSQSQSPITLDSTLLLFALVTGN